MTITREGLFELAKKAQRNAPFGIAVSIDPGSLLELLERYNQAPGRDAQQAVDEAIAAQRQRALRVFTQSDRCQLCGAWRNEHSGAMLECPPLPDQKGSSRDDDPELAALRTCARLLQPLDADARERVLSYLRRRFIDEASE